MIYLTFNEGVSGIFQSQVIDVVRFLNKQTRVKLYSFISLRGFFQTRKKIKSELPDAIVLPMFPTMRLWKLNRFTLYLFLLFSRDKKIMGRSVWATWLALKAKSLKLADKVIYDGRGAVYHESAEYKVLEDENLINEIRSVENDAINKSDFRLAVSRQMITFWNEFYNYSANSHVVIPCTLNSGFINGSGIESDNSDYTQKNIIAVYSGSAAGWQTAGPLTNLIDALFTANENFRLIIVSPDQDGWRHLKSKYNDKVSVKSVKHSEVHSILNKADYGLLVREESVTNKVASPVKFAEYLASGLKVLISNNLGDFSEFALKNDCGYVVDGSETLIKLQAVSPEEKVRIRSLAAKSFMKENFLEEYKKIIAV